MVTDFMNLTENYTTKKIMFNDLSELPKAIITENEISIPVIYEHQLSPELRNKVRCSALVPLAITGTAMLAQMTPVSDLGWTNMLLPLVMKFAVEAGRIIFYINGATALYKVTKGDTAGGFKQLKNAVIGYSLLISLDLGVYMIESYVNEAKNAVMGMM